jgi:putative transposase
MHRTLKQEATIPPASSLKGQQRKFDKFQRDFNEERPHEAIDMNRPAELYRPSPRQMSAKLETYDYPGHHLVRRVSRAGTIRAFGRQLFVSSTLMEDYVGLEEVADGVYDLYFCFYQIGRYDVRENRIQDVISKVGVGRQQIDRAGRV